MGGIVSTPSPESALSPTAHSSPPSPTKRTHKKRKRERDPARFERSSKQSCCALPASPASSASPDTQSNQQNYKSHNYYKGFRKRACLCGSPECVKLWKRAIDVGDSRRCGYWYVPKEARESVYYHLRGNGTLPPENKRKGNEEWISYGHIDPRMLQDNNKGPISDVGASLATDVGLKDHDKKPGRDAYFPAPTYTLGSLERDINSLEVASEFTAALCEGSLLPTSDRLPPECRQIASTYRKMVQEPGKMSIEFVKMQERLLLLEIECSEKEKENKKLDADIKEMKESLRMQKLIEDSSGMCRKNVGCRKWHEKCKDASHFWFGLGEFKHCIGYIKIFWEIEYEVGSSKDAPLTSFEQILVCLLKIHRSYDDETIRLIFHRTGHSFVTDIMKKWLPVIGRTGLDMSILPLDFTMDYVTAEYAREHNLPHYTFDDSPKDKAKNYIDATVPQPYIDLGYWDVWALVDGMVIRTDTVRVNAVVNRISYNSKVDDSGALSLTWTTPTGLCFEHTGLYFGRVEEVRLVELWGTVDSNNIQLGRELN